MVLTALPATAATILVSTADTFRAALAGAGPGDEIVLQDGSYSGNFILANSGTMGQPITIRARHPHKSIFSRSLLELKGDHAVLTGWQEDFSRGMERWWSEGGERVWVENGRLHVWADKPAQPGGGVATAWCREPLPANFEFEVDARVIGSSIAANNINLFLCYSDPSGRPMEETREARHTADYRFYHALNGYIVTFLNEKGQARIRLRRNPGFNLLVEDRVGECRAGVTYRLKVRMQNGEIVFCVDGRELARYTDPAPWRGGLLGLRTFRTNLWWDNVRVRSLGPGQ